jgi:hypothetical protein
MRPRPDADARSTRPLRSAPAQAAVARRVHRGGPPVGRPRARLSHPQVSGQAAARAGRRGPQGAPAAVCRATAGPGPRRARVRQPARGAAVAEGRRQGGDRAGDAGDAAAVRNGCGPGCRLGAQEAQRKCVGPAPFLEQLDLPRPDTASPSTLPRLPQASTRPPAAPHWPFPRPMLWRCTCGRPPGWPRTWCGSWRMPVAA